MRPGLMIGTRHVVRYTVPAHQTVPDLLPALAEFRRGQPAFATGFMVGLMEAHAWPRSIRTWNPAR